MSRPVRRPCASCHTDQIHIGLRCIECGQDTVLSPVTTIDVANGKKARESSARLRQVGRPKLTDAERMQRQRERRRARA